MQAETADRSAIVTSEDESVELPAPEEPPDFYDPDRSEEHRTTKTDAILSCPCCLEIVCVDCQRHETYHDQFRAMFVRNIHVDWGTKLVLDNERGLVETTKEFEYYKVTCANCHTPVAALDKEEVYHFYGCLASE